MTASVPDHQSDTATQRSQPHHAGHTTDHDAEPLVDAIERDTSDADSGYWMSHDDLALPGFGEPYDDCGEDFPFFCAGCGKPRNFGRTCYRSVCQRCAASWARRTATRVCAKIASLRAYYDAAREPNQRYHHVVVSPDPDWRPDGDGADWEGAIETVKRVLSAAGHTGWIAYHPYRGVDGDDRGVWKERIFGDQRWDDVADDLRFQPHFHCVIVGHRTPGGDVTREIERRTGWIVKRITKQNSNVSLYNDFDLARAVTYTLSHTGIIAPDDGQNRACTRWFGEHVNRVTASDAQEAAMDAVVRAVAPKTLGLPFNRLACDDQADEDELAARDYEDVDVAAAAASRTAGPFVGAGGGRTDLPDDDPRLQDGAVELDTTGDVLPAGATAVSGGETGGEGAETTDPPDGDASSDADRDDEPATERCAGRMLPIPKAPAFLENPDWREQARYDDDLADVHAEWAAHDEFVPSRDTVDEADIDRIDAIMDQRNHSDPFQNTPPPD